MRNYQKQFHKTFLKVLDNIGIIGTILTAIADIVFVVIFVIGIKIDISLKSAIIFSVINALIGVAINVLLRYQGQKYAEIENKELLEEYCEHKVKERKHLTTLQYNIISFLKDVILKGACSTFSIYGLIYISIEGSKNPIQILLTIVNLILFICLGLMAMNNSYNRYYTYQIPLMEIELKLKEEEKNVSN